MILESPNYPKPYNNRDYCVYAVVCERPNVKLTLNFTAFELEDSKNCLNDYVVVRDGTRTNSTVLGHFCGTTVKKNPIISSGQRLMLNLFTNANITKKGFQATVSCPGKIC